MEMNINLVSGSHVYRTIKSGSETNHCIPCRNGGGGRGEKGGRDGEAVNFYWAYLQFYKHTYAICA